MYIYILESVFFQIILEKKQLGDLYHIIDYEKMMYILKNNKITSYRAGGGKISLTRNKMLNSYLGDSPQSFLKLLIDGDGLSDNYKIKPFAYKSLNNQRFTEYEEQVQMHYLNNGCNFFVCSEPLVILFFDYYLIWNK